MARLLKIGIGSLVALLLALIVVLRSGLLTPGKEPIPIAGKPFAGEHFVNYPVTPQPLTGFAARQILHPFMAFEGGGLHGNAYNSDVHVTGGPLGNDLQVKSRSVSPLPGGLCPTITFARSGLIVAMCASFLGFELNLFEPHSLDLLATHKLVTRPSTFEAAVDFALYQYQGYMEGFLKAKHRIASKHFIEIRYEDFVTDRMRWLGILYEKLELGDFVAMAGPLAEYIRRTEHYEPHRFAEDPVLKARIDAKLGFAIAALGYGTAPASTPPC